MLSDVLPLGDSVSEIHFSALSIMTSALRLHHLHLNIPGTLTFSAGPCFMVMFFAVIVKDLFFFPKVIKAN